MRKTCRKLVGILLSVIMLIGVFPVTAKSAYNNYQYRCVVTTDGTTFYSDYAALTVE